MSEAEKAETIAQAVLQLQPEARAKLAHSLVDSLGEITEEQLQSLWLDEAERRDKEMECGKVKGLSGEEVFSQIESKYRRQCCGMSFTLFNPIPVGTLQFITG